MQTVTAPHRPAPGDRLDVRSIRLTPHGQLQVLADTGASGAESIRTAFLRGSGHGLLALAFDAPAIALPFDLAFWRDFAAQFVTGICARPQPQEPSRAVVELSAPEDAVIGGLMDGAPPMQGGEYLTARVISDLWQAMNTALSTEVAEGCQPIGDFLKRRSPSWSLVGRVHFNLAENRKDEGAPLKAKGAPSSLHFNLA